ncbi:Wadjet anti-phage system protein JetD domain-containing protein [Kitasatospora sp. NPDC088391]|uniref:Wadjet anti-phage system protein JetD domain-containing protein n=1 Tax=Kitasatospora sp. NPDC088391 TaxID=3364074 RepID=UPI00380840DB
MPHHRNDPQDSAEPSAQATELLHRLRESAEKSGWKGAKGKQIPIADVINAADGIPAPSGREHVIPRNLLAAYLGELRKFRHLKYSDTRTDHEKDSLPLQVLLLPYRSPVRQMPPEPVWHSSMSWASPYWEKHYTTAPIRAAYTAMNKWLHSGSSGRALPVRERALEIFGSEAFFQQAKHPGEKVFDSLNPKPVLSDPARLLPLINAFRVDPPLLTRAFDTVPLGEEEGGYHRTGPGRGLLVVENSTTYWSISQLLKHVDHGLGHVAWGIGNTFTASIGSLGRDDNISHVVYFGDLDTTGLRIPLTALRRRLPWLESVRPAVGLYDMLLRHGRPAKAMPKEARIAPAEARRLADWLDPAHRERAVDLLLRGERLAQEWVNLDRLSTETDWHGDVR